MQVGTGAGKPVDVGTAVGKPDDDGTGVGKPDDAGTSADPSTSHDRTGLNGLVCVQECLQSHSRTRPVYGVRG